MFHSEGGWAQAPQGSDHSINPDTVLEESWAHAVTLGVSCTGTGFALNDPDGIQLSTFHDSMFYMPCSVLHHSFWPLAPPFLDLY